MYLLGEKDCDRIDVILTALSAQGENEEFNNSRKAKFVRKKLDKLIRILGAVDSCLEETH
jgi:hypothetical protein